MYDCATWWLIYELSLTIFSFPYSTIQQVEDILHGACDILVGMEQDCYNFVDANLQKIVDLLVNEYLSPEAICNELALCP